MSYESIKNELFEENTLRKIQLSHGELHVLYLTFIESSIMIILIKWFNFSMISPFPFIFISCVSFIGAIISDIRQYSYEAHIIKNIGAEKIKEYLSKNGFI